MDNRIAHTAWKGPIFNRELDKKDIKAIESILSKDDRVELIPVKNGVKIIHIKREEVKAK